MSTPKGQTAPTSNASPEIDPGQKIKNFTAAATAARLKKEIYDLECRKAEVLDKGDLDKSDIDLVLKLTDRIAELEPAFDDAEYQSLNCPAEAPELSEMALAEAFAEAGKGRFRWSPGMDWMHNEGTHWERDDRLRRFTAAKAVCREAAEGAEKAQAAAKLCSSGVGSAVLHLARSEPQMNTAVADWDSSPMLFNTPGGVYDLTTGEQVPREKFLFTQVSGVAPARIATPIWDRFLAAVFDGDVAMIEFIQRMFGYCLTADIREQKLFFLYGAGANGKSVLLEVLQYILGRYSHNLPAEALMTAKHERHPTTFAALQGKRVAISSEIEESSHWAESRIKSLTGDSTLTARFMRGDEFTFRISHKHVLAGNFKPRLKGDDFAMQRRMVLVPFTQQFTGTRRDESLPEKLKAEYPGILAWAIEGAAKWADSGLLIPQSVQESSREYMAEQNDIELWIDECCNVGDGLRCISTELFQSFSAWKQRNGENAGSIRTFSQRLERLFTKEKNKRGREFLRVSLKPDQGDFSGNAYLKNSRGGF